MKKTLIKVVSVALAASVVLSVAACQKKKGGNGKEGSHSGEKIDANSPWFDGKEIKIEEAYDTSKETDYINYSIAGADDDYLVIGVNGYYKMPSDDNINWEDINYADYEIAGIAVLDRKTYDTINTVDLIKLLPEGGYMESISFSKGIATLTVDTYDSTTYNMTTYEIEIDPMTGKKLDERTIDRDFEGGSVEHTFLIGDFKIDTAMAWDKDDNGYYLLYVTDPDGNKKTLEVKDDKTPIWDISVLLPIDKDLVLVPASTDDDMKYYTLDLNSYEIKEADIKEYEWLDIDAIVSSTIGKDGYIYFTTSNGISKVDMKKKSIEEVFNYSWCGVNRNALSYLDIVEASEDRFLVCGSNWTYNPFSSNSSNDFRMFEFTKADKNPHAGKKILELYSSYGYLSDQAADAVMMFNETNPDYFIEVTDRYTDTVEYEYSESNNPDDYEKMDMNYNSEMSNVLAMDIINGDGPDILLDVSQYGQLNNSNYLADLTPYVSDLDSDKYFTNIIDASKTDGALYQLPLTFYISGIQTNSKNAGKSGIGFTTEEYEKFLNDKLNGNDVINSGQAIYFARLFTAMNDKFIVNGKADFKCDEFAQLAEFVKENIPENAKSWDELYDDYAITYAIGASFFKGDRFGMEPSVAIEVNCGGIGSYLMNQAEVVEGDAILGIPSTDGRGPCVNPSRSVAISAQAESIDACGEFVKLLLSDDIQMKLGMQDNLVLNREVFREVGKTAIDFYNGEGSYYFDAYDPMTGRPLENKMRPFTEKDIDTMEQIVLNCTKTATPDAAINLILVEEMPAYFSGQKDLDSVVTIIEDRVQKVLNERG